MCDLFNLLLKDLRNMSSTVRIASFKKFYNLACRADEQLRQKIFIVLYLHLKNITNPTPHSPTEPTKEVQSLLDTLFKPDSNNDFIFNNIDVNLQGAHLQGVNLYKANLQSVNLQDANLHGANLQSVNLQDANLQDALLDAAKMQNAELHGAELQLHRTDMFWARINTYTYKKMPDKWKGLVRQYNGKTGAFLVDENDEVIENL